MRDLKGVHIRLGSLDTSSSRSQFLSVALWGLLKQTKEQHQAVCVAVSHQASLRGRSASGCSELTHLERILPNPRDTRSVSEGYIA